MGRRSSFRRVPRDFYRAPFKAVPPLMPYLRSVRTFAEPCAGNGALVRHLEGVGLRCAYAGDIATGQDALARDSYGAADAIITNPPYTRELMHPLIKHFQRIAPTTWLLIDYDWAATKQAAPFLSHSSDIVMLPRLKWIEGSKDTGTSERLPRASEPRRPATRKPMRHSKRCGSAPRPMSPPTPNGSTAQAGRRR
jgi:hypothetical protein